MPCQGGCGSRLRFACDAGNTLADDPLRGVPYRARSIAEGNAMSRQDEAWNDVCEQFDKLGSMFKSHYEEQGGKEGTESIPEDEIIAAVRTLGESIKTVFATVGDAFNDPDVQEEAKQTAGSFFDALAATFSELGDDISTWWERGEPADSPPRTEATPPDAPEEDE
jgi:Flp pilus assembly pilin Flp